MLCLSLRKLQIRTEIQSEVTKLVELGQDTDHKWKWVTIPEKTVSQEALLIVYKAACKEIMDKKEKYGITQRIFKDDVDGIVNKVASKDASIDKEKWKRQLYKVIGLNTFPLDKLPDNIQYLVASKIDGTPAQRIRTGLVSKTFALASKTTLQNPNDQRAIYHLKFERMVRELSKQTKTSFLSYYEDKNELSFVLDYNPWGEEITDDRLWVYLYKTMEKEDQIGYYVEEIHPGYVTEEKVDEDGVTFGRFLDTFRREIKTAKAKYKVTQDDFEKYGYGAYENTKFVFEKSKA